MPIFRRWTEQLKQVGAIEDGTGSWGEHTATISGGAITVTQPGVYIVTPEGGVADELATINGGLSGYEIWLLAVDSTNTITVKHGTDNIQIGYDFNLDHKYDALRLLKLSDGNWIGGAINDNS